MRTTLVIDDHLLREAKRRAVEAGITLSEFASWALREALRDHDQPGTTAPFSMAVYGSGLQRDTSVRELADIRDDGR